MSIKKQKCELCGAEISGLFSMDDHQSSKTCSALRNYHEMYEQGWRPLASKFALAVADTGLPIRTIMVPVKALPKDKRAYYYTNSFREWDKLAHDKLLMLSIAPSWVVEVLETIVEQRKAIPLNKIVLDLADTEKLSKNMRKLITYLHKASPEDRGIFLTAMRLGGMKRACEMWRKQCNGNS